MSVALLCDGRWRGMHGIGRFATEVLARLPGRTELTGGPRPLSPADPLWLAMQNALRRPSVYFSPGFNPPPAGVRSLVFTIHDLIHLSVKDESSRLKRLYYESIVKPACRRAFRVLTVSEHSRARILDWAGLPAERVVVVGNGVSPPFSNAADPNPPDRRYVLYAGNYKPHKNLARLFAAFSRLRDRDVELWLVGNPRRDLVAQLEPLRISARTRFTSPASDAMLARLYRQAALVVVPGYAEGFGLTALEAMACGAVVVAANAAALPEVVGPAALLADPFDIDSLTAAMDRGLSDTALRDALRREGPARSRLFTWEKVGAAVGSVLGEAGWPGPFTEFLQARG